MEKIPQDQITAYHGHIGSLQEQITALLRRQPNMRAIEITRALAKDGTHVNKVNVNRVLYGGPFDQTCMASSAPSWKVRESAAAGGELLHQEGCLTFKVDRVGSFILQADLPDEQLKRLLDLVGSLIPPDATRVVRSDSSPDGLRVARLAESLDFVVQPS